MLNKPFRGAGCLLYTPSGHCLWLLRNEDPATWCGAGGGIENGETARIAAVRELEEELGYHIDPSQMRPFCKYESPDLHFYNYLCQVPEQFVPRLNDEHIGYCWTDPSKFMPGPMHFGVPFMVKHGLLDQVKSSTQ